MNRINFDALIQVILEIFISAALAVNLMTGNINRFVHPKFNPVIWITVSVFIIIAFFTSLDMFRVRHMYNLNRYFVLAIPLIFSVYVTRTSFTSDIDTGTSQAASIQYSNAEDGNSSVSPSLREYRKTEYVKSDDGYIDIDDSSYLKWYYDSTYKWKDYKGDRFRFLARVFKDSGQKGKFVVLGRLGMVCCAADMQPCGFIYNGRGYEKLKDDQWYWVTCEIGENDRKYVYNYQELPMLKKVELKPAREPTDPYVYIQ